MSAKSYRVPECVSAKIISILVDEKVAQHTALSVKGISKKFSDRTGKPLKEAMNCEGVDEDWWILLRSLKGAQSMQIGNRPSVDTIHFYIEKPFTVEQEKVIRLVKKLLASSTDGSIASIEEQYRSSPKYESLSQHVASVFDGISVKNFLLKVIRARVDRSHATHTYSLFASPKKKERQRDDQSSKSFVQPQFTFEDVEMEVDNTHSHEHSSSSNNNNKSTYRCPDDVRDEIINILTSEGATIEEPMTAMLLANNYSNKRHKTTQLKVAMNCDSERKPWWILLRSIGGPVRSFVTEGKASATTTFFYIKPPKFSMNEPRSNLIRDVKLLLNLFPQGVDPQLIKARYDLLYGRLNGFLADNVKLHFEGMSLEEFFLKIIKVKSREGGEKSEADECNDGDYDKGGHNLPQSLLGKRIGRRSLNSPSPKRVARSEEHEVTMVSQFSPVPERQNKVTFVSPPPSAFENDVAPDVNAGFSPLDQGVANNYNEDEMEVDYDENYEKDVQTQEQKGHLLKEQAVVTELTALIKSVKHKPFDRSVGELLNEFLVNNVQYFTDESLILFLSCCGEGKDDDPIPAAVKGVKLRFLERCLIEGSLATQPLTPDGLRRLLQTMHRKFCGSFRADNDLLSVFLKMFKMRLERHVHMQMVVDAEVLAECFRYLRHIPFGIDYLALVDILSQFAAFMPTKFNREQITHVIYGLKSIEVYDEHVSVILLRITSMTETTTPTTSATETINDKEVLEQCKYLGKSLLRMLQYVARGGSHSPDKDKDRDRDTGSVTSTSVASLSIASSSSSQKRVVTNRKIMKPLLFLIACWTSGIESLLILSSIAKDDDLVACLFKSLKDQGQAITLYSEFRRLLVTFVRYSRKRSTTTSLKEDMKTLDNLLAFIASMKDYDSSIQEVRELLVYFTKELNDHHVRIAKDRDGYYKQAVSHGYGPLQLRRALCGLRSDCIVVRQFVVALHPWLEQSPDQRAVLSHSDGAIKYGIFTSLIGMAGLGAPLRQSLTNPAVQTKTILEDYEDQFVYGFVLPVIDEQLSSLGNVDIDFLIRIAPALKVAEDVVFERISTLLVTKITVSMASLLLKGEVVISAVSAIINALLEGDSLINDHGERTLSESYRSLLATCFGFLKNTADGGVMNSSLSSLGAFRATLNITLDCSNHVCLLPTSEAFSLLTGCVQNLISTIQLAGSEKKTQLAIALLNTICKCSSPLWLRWYNPVSTVAFITAFNAFFLHVQAFTAGTDESIVTQARSTFDVVIQSMTVQALIASYESNQAQQHQQEGKIFVDRLIGSIAVSLYPNKIERDLMLLPSLLKWGSFLQMASPCYDFLRSTIGSLVKELLDIQFIHLLTNALKTKATIAKEAIQQWRDSLIDHIVKTTKIGNLNDVNTQRVTMLQELTQPGRAEHLLSFMLPLLIPNANEVDQKLSSDVIVLAGILFAVAWTNTPLPSSNSGFLEYYQAIRRMRLPIIFDEIAVAGNDTDGSKVLNVVKDMIGEIEDSLFGDVIIKRIESLNGEQYLDSRNLRFVYEGVMSTFASHRRLQSTSPEVKDKLESVLNDIYLRGKGVISYPQYQSSRAVEGEALVVPPSWWGTAVEDETVLHFVRNTLCSAASGNESASLTTQHAWASFTDHVLVCGLPALFSFDYVAENEGILAGQLTRLNIAINSQATDQKAGFMVSPGLLKIVQHLRRDQDNKMAVDEAKDAPARMKLLVDVIPTASTTMQARLLEQQKVLDEDAALKCHQFNGCISVLIFVSTNPNVAEEEGEELNWSHLTLIKSRTRRMLSLLLKSLELQQ